MDLLKLLNSLEDLVVEVALWLVLLPRTLFAAIFRPVTLASYFDQMQPIPVEERDDKYLSPVLFWILIAPVSLILTLAGADKEAFALYGDGWQERLTTAVLMLLGPPVGFALASLLIRREAVTKKSLGRHFALQCYYHAPMALLVVLAVIVDFEFLESRFGEEVSNAVAMVVSLPMLAWFVITQYRVARREIEPAKAAGVTALGCGFGLVLMIAIALAIMLVFFLIGRTPGFGR